MFSKIWKKLSGKSDDDVQVQIVRLNSEVVSLYQQGKYEEAIQYASMSANLTRTALGEKHPSFARSLNNLGTLYFSMGDYDAAEPLLKQAMEIRHTALGEQHPDFATSLNDLSALYESMGDHAAAVPLLKQAMEIYRTALGEQHPSFATSLNNLAQLYESTGDYAAAEPLYKQAMEIWRNALGEQHPDFATSLDLENPLLRSGLALMEMFYQKILDGQPRSEALREAQLEIREKNPHPLYWGAFICQGDPNQLSYRR